MGHIMPNNISLTLTPNFITSPPQIKIFINNELIHDGDLQDKKEWIHTTNIDRSLRLRIIRSGRTKDISHRDNANGLQITDYTVNGVKIDPAIGSYNVSNNDYVETHVVHGNQLTLNGEYFLEIPYYHLKGEIKQKNLEKFNFTKQHNEYAFFGASMTDYDFSLGSPPISNKKSYADLFLQDHNGINLATGGQTNQEVFETVYHYLQENTAKIIFVQLISSVVRQVKNIKTKQLKRYSPHMEDDLDYFDELTQSSLKSIQNYFVHLDVAPIIALQIPEYQKLIRYAEEKGSKIYFVNYFQDEHKIFNTIFPNNMAPYFRIDTNTKYYKENGAHATVEEQEIYYQSIVDFIGKTL